MRTSVSSSVERTAATTSRSEARAAHGPADVGVEAAMASSGFDERMFFERGGKYKWSKGPANADGGCTLPKELEW